MDKLLAVVFSEESAAQQGVRALYALDGEGGIELRTLRLIRKNADGTVTQQRTEDDFAPPARTLAGLTLGSIGSGTAADRS